MEGGSTWQQSNLVSILDREHPGLHQVHHVKPELQDQGTRAFAAFSPSNLFFLPFSQWWDVRVCVQGEKDWQKYETARRLKKCVDRIRAQYREDWKSKEMRIRQRAVALYFIDKVNNNTIKLWWLHQVIK